MNGRTCTALFSLTHPIFTNISRTYSIYIFSDNIYFFIFVNIFFFVNIRIREKILIFHKS